MSMVRYKLGEVPPLSDEEMAALRAEPPADDSEIDYSDIPQLDDDFWENAVRGLFYRPVKKQISLRIDADVIAWLKEDGPDWHIRLNAYLRREMQRSRRAATQAKARQATPAADDA